MAFLVVVTGPPGAGKSTVARALADKLDRSVLVAGDAFFGFLARDAVAPWLPAAHRQNEVVVQAAAAAADRFVAGGYNTVYDGVIGPWFLADFAAGAAVGHLHYVVLLPRWTGAWIRWPPAPVTASPTKPQPDTCTGSSREQNRPLARAG
jgi:hypothetical protein